jgi:hypothetical protein
VHYEPEFVWKVILMCCQSTSGRWRHCPGCGRERRLAPGRAVMAGHNRWDSAAWAMVRCEGSQQLPRPAGAPDAVAAQDPMPAGDGQAA